MFKGLSLSAKLFFIVTPLFFVTFGSLVYINYTFQQEQVLGEAKLAATSLASTVKKSMVHMMLKYQMIDDGYLQQLSQGGHEIQRLQVLFFLDSLHLQRQYRTPQRLKKLREREQEIAVYRSLETDQAFKQGETKMVMVCDPSLHVTEMPKHEDYPISEVSEGVPVKFWTCGKLHVVLPFRAEARCQSCHQVPEGAVLGAASMELPFGSTITAIRANAARSVSIFVALTVLTLVLGAFVYRRMIGSPVNRLLHAIKMTGKQGLDFRIATNFDDDELGKLADSFREMQRELIEAHNEVIHKERLSTIGQMASGIIHDFRNPMSAITTTLQVLQIRKDLTPQRQKELHDLILSSVDRMNRMAQELLDYSRGEVKLNVQPVDVRTMIEEIDMVARKHLENHNIRFSIHCTCATIVALDKDGIQRALINIINNAEDALEKNKGGTIELTVASADAHVLFSVRDDGGGIPESIRDRVFDAFVTAGKAKGTGLGLAICKKVVEQHGGELYFETDTGKGTTFFVKLPLVQQSVSLAA